MMQTPPSPSHAVIIAGPNGAGKSTLAPRLLAREFDIYTFVNADIVAQGLAAYDPASVAIQAGRIVSGWIERLREFRSSFAFETTLSGRGLRRTIGDLHTAGYVTHLVYLWLPSLDLSAERVRLRVRTGGHDVPVADLRRRFLRSVVNFEHVYRRIVSDWRVYHAVRHLTAAPRLIADGTRDSIKVFDATAWEQIQEQAHAGESEGRIGEEA